MISNELTRTRQPKSRRLPTFYPSSASVKLADGDVVGGCWRSDWYRVNGIEETNKPDFYLAMIFQLGHAVEATVVEAMKKAGIFEANNTKFYDPRYNVSGELDVVGRYRKSDNSIGYYGVEVKSVYGIGATLTITGRSRAWRGQPAVRPKPKDQNLMQTMIYIDQFSSESGGEFELEGFKLLYLPRDKPVDGRYYDISLVSIDDLSGPLLARHRADMKPSNRYALIETEGHDSYVETRFSIEEMYARFAEQKEIFSSDKAPPRPFKKFYTDDEVERLYSLGKLSKTAYTDWENNKKRPGHFLCQSYCNYRDYCYKKSGAPRLEADKLVQITEKE